MSGAPNISHIQHALSRELQILFSAHGRRIAAFRREVKNMTEFALSEIDRAITLQSQKRDNADPVADHGDAKSRSLPPEKSESKNAHVVTPSAEQKAILDAYLAGHNIVVRAVAGAGKSTSLLMCAQADEKKRCQIFTYNKRLQLDVAEKIAQKQITNASARTYHAAAGCAYGALVKDDQTLIGKLKTHMRHANRLHADSFMMDEMQDMSVQGHIFVKRLTGAMIRQPQHIVVGDERQAIYEYVDARVEFLTKCEELFPVEDERRRWVSLTLSTSYRLTPATAKFVNRHVLAASGSDIEIVGGNTRDPNVKPLFVTTTFHSAPEVLRLTVEGAIRKYGVSNVAILAPSVKCIKRANKHPLATLVRNLSVPIYTQIRDDGAMDEKAAAGKLAIVTFNAMKGCERDCVILMHFDETYFRLYNRDWHGIGNEVPNVIYVAATRARKRLIVVSERDKILRSVDLNTLHVDAEITDSRKLKQDKKSPRPPPDSIGITDLLQHQSPSTIMRMMQLIEIKDTKNVVTPSRIAEMFVSFGKYGESVANLYGIVVPVLVELAKNGNTDQFDKITTPNIVEREKDVQPFSTDITYHTYSMYPKEFWPQIQRTQKTAQKVRSFTDWFRLAVARNALIDGMHHIARQILHYKWIDVEFVRDCVRCVFKALQLTNGKFEVKLSTFVVMGAEKDKTFSDRKIQVGGYADFIENDHKSRGAIHQPCGAVWEFKCTKEPTNEHLLQLACYMVLNKSTVGHLYCFLGGHITTIELKDGVQDLLSIALEKYSPRPVPRDIHDEIKDFRLRHGIPDIVEPPYDPDDPIEDFDETAFDDAYSSDPSADDSQVDLDDVYE